MIPRGHLVTGGVPYSTQHTPMYQVTLKQVHAFYSVNCLYRESLGY